MMDLSPRRRRGPKPGGRPVRPQLHHGGAGPRPLIWKTGPDPVIHAQFVAFGRARAQALFRQEGWLMTFQEFQRIWGPDWPQRGRHSTDLCMTRSHTDLPWSADNVELITRAEHNRRCSQRKMMLR